MTSRTEPVRIFAPAKINLLLHVGDRRADGFHDLESLVVFADAGDTLTFAPAEELSLAVDGPFASCLAMETDNLVLRAARAMQSHFGRSEGAAIALTKNLPVASGIGGGSADAAATLRGLARLWEVETYPSELCAIAETLGSDVPVCVESRSSWMEGRGEQITPARGIPAAAMVLANPGVAVPTAKVFGALRMRSGIGSADRQLYGNDTWSLAEYLRATANDLEAPALEIAPAIGEVLAALRAQEGVYLARMSGSGATCFALFESDAAAEVAARVIAAAHPGWWVRASRILA